jgi:hypothetical protein
MNDGFMDVSQMKLKVINKNTKKNLSPLKYAPQAEGSNIKVY